MYPLSMNVWAGLWCCNEYCFTRLPFHVTKCCFSLSLLNSQPIPSLRPQSSTAVKYFLLLIVFLQVHLHFLSFMLFNCNLFNCMLLWFFPLALIWFSQCMVHVLAARNVWVSLLWSVTYALLYSSLLEVALDKASAKMHKCTAIWCHWGQCFSSVSWSSTRHNNCYHTSWVIILFHHIWSRRLTPRFQKHSKTVLSSWKMPSELLQGRVGLWQAPIQGGGPASRALFPPWTMRDREIYPFIVGFSWIHMVIRSELCWKRAQTRYDRGF